MFTFLGPGALARAPPGVDSLKQFLLLFTSALSLCIDTGSPGFALLNHLDTCLEHQSPSVTVEPRLHFRITWGTVENKNPVQSIWVGLGGLLCKQGSWLVLTQGVLGSDLQKVCGEGLGLGLTAVWLGPGWERRGLSGCLSCVSLSCMNSPVQPSWSPAHRAQPVP